MKNLQKASLGNTLCWWWLLHKQLGRTGTERASNTGGKATCFRQADGEGGHYTHLHMCQFGKTNMGQNCWPLSIEILFEPPSTAVQPVFSKILKSNYYLYREPPNVLGLLQHPTTFLINILQLHSFMPASFNAFLLSLYIFQDHLIGFILNTEKGA